MEETPTLDLCMRMAMIRLCLARMKSQTRSCRQVCLCAGFATRMQILLHCVRQLRPEYRVMSAAGASRFESLRSLVQHQLQSGVPDRALANVFELLIIAPTSPEAYLLAGQALEFLDADTAATLFYQEILDHQSGHALDAVEARHRLDRLRSKPSYVPPPDHGWLFATEATVSN